MKLYRAMCQEEFDSVTEKSPLAWNSKHKWFGTREFVLSRVRDGKFNNSKFVKERYLHLVEYEVESGLEHFINCGKNEFMLNVRKAPLVKLKVNKLQRKHDDY